MEVRAGTRSVRPVLLFASRSTSGAKPMEMCRRAEAVAVVEVGLPDIVGGCKLWATGRRQMEGWQRTGKKR